MSLKLCWNGEWHHSYMKCGKTWKKATAILTALFFKAPWTMFIGQVILCSAICATVTKFQLQNAKFIERIQWCTVCLFYPIAMSVALRGNQYSWPPLESLFCLSLTEACLTGMSDPEEFILPRRIGLSFPVFFSKPSASIFFLHPDSWLKLECAAR